MTQELLEQVTSELETIGPHDNAGLTDLAVRCLDEQPDPADVAHALDRMGLAADTLDAEMQRIEKRREAAAVFAQLEDRQRASRAAIDHHTDIEKAAEKAKQAVTAEHMKRIREAAVAREEARQRVAESEEARHRLMESATKQQRERRWEAGQQRIKAQQRLGEVQHRHDESKAILESRQRRLDSGKYLNSIRQGDKQAARAQVEASVTEAKRRVKADAESLAAAQTAVEFARQNYDAAAEEMLEP